MAPPASEFCPVDQSKKQSEQEQRQVRRPTSVKVNETPERHQADEGSFRALFLDQMSR